MKTNETFKEFVISKKMMNSIKGGDSINIICPDCHEDDWKIETNGNTTKITCLTCGYTKSYPGI